jgi:predicted ribonuclease YlaK
MPARKSRSSSSNVGGRRKDTSIDLSKILDIVPQTKNQELYFEAYRNQKNIVAHGAAGTGKTFICLYNALREVLDYKTPFNKIYLVRSLVPTREIGFLPGDHSDKAALYEIPYKNMVQYMFTMSTDEQFETLYSNLKLQNTISFWSTSFIRGTTFDNSIIIVDEFSNLNFHELDSIITRVGDNTKIFFCGDRSQSDLSRTNERTGIVDFMSILKKMPSFETIEFTIDDVVRSGLCKEYLLAKHHSGFN